MVDNLLSQFSLHGNWVDFILIVLIIYFMLTNNGFIASFFDLLGFFFAFIFSFKTYQLFAKLLIANFSFSKGIANASGFFIAWMLSEIIFFILTKLTVSKIPSRIFPHKLNRVLGILPAAIEAIILFTFILTLTITFPLKGNIKDAVLKSKSGPILIGFSQKFESDIRSVFHEAVTETLNFLTITEGSEEKVNLGFEAKQKDLHPDSVSEMTLFNLVNKERQSRGIKPLEFDEKLRNVAREYAKEMFIYGFFSHYSVIDGSSPSQRIDRAAIKYTIAGENLAFAPDVKIAHQGLMNSPGHRENILLPKYTKIGVGVIDDGVFGKMFVQEFTD